MYILRQYEENGYLVIEYSRDGKTVATTVKQPKLGDSDPIEPQPTLEEMQAQTLLNTEYLVSRSELGI